MFLKFIYIILKLNFRKNHNFFTFPISRFFLNFPSFPLLFLSLFINFSAIYSFAGQDPSRQYWLNALDSLSVTSHGDFAEATECLYEGLTGLRKGGWGYDTDESLRADLKVSYGAIFDQLCQAEYVLGDMLNGENIADILKTYELQYYTYNGQPATDALEYCMAMDSNPVEIVCNCASVFGDLIPNSVWLVLPDGTREQYGCLQFALSEAYNRFSIGDELYIDDEFRTELIDMCALYISKADEEEYLSSKETGNYQDLTDTVRTHSDYWKTLSFSGAGCGFPTASDAVIKLKSYISAWEQLTEKGGKFDPPLIKINGCMTNGSYSDTVITVSANANSNCLNIGYFIYDYFEASARNFVNSLVGVDIITEMTSHEVFAQTYQKAVCGDGIDIYILEPPDGEKQVFTSLLETLAVAKQWKIGDELYIIFNGNRTIVDMCCLYRNMTRLKNYEAEVEPNEYEKLLYAIQDFNKAWSNLKFVSITCGFPTASLALAKVKSITDVINSIEGFSKKDVAPPLEVRISGCEGEGKYINNRMSVSTDEDRNLYLIGQYFYESYGSKIRNFMIEIFKGRELTEDEFATRFRDWFKNKGKRTTLDQALPCLFKNILEMRGECKKPKVFDISSLGQYFFLNKTARNKIDCRIDWGGDEGDAKVKINNQEQNIEDTASFIWDMGSKFFTDDEFCPDVCDDLGCREDCSKKNCMSVNAKTDEYGFEDEKEYCFNMASIPDWLSLLGELDIFEVAEELDFLTYTFEKRIPCRKDAGTGLCSEQHNFRLMMTPVNTPAPLWKIWEAVPVIGGEKLGIESYFMLRLVAQSNGEITGTIKGNLMASAMGTDISGGIGSGVSIAFEEVSPRKWSMDMQELFVELFFSGEFFKEVGPVTVFPILSNSTHYPLVGPAIEWVNNHALIRFGLAFIQGADMPLIRLEFRKDDQDGLVFDEASGTSTMGIKLAMIMKVTEQVKAEVSGVGSIRISWQVPPSVEKGYISSIKLLFRPEIKLTYQESASSPPVELVNATEWDVELWDDTAPGGRRKSTRELEYKPFERTYYGEAVEGGMPSDLFLAIKGLKVLCGMDSGLVDTNGNHKTELSDVVKLLQKSVEG